MNNINNNEFNKSKVAIGNKIGGNLDQSTTTNTTKNIGVLGVLGTLILIAILAIITFYFLGIDRKDIGSIFESDPGLSDKQKILMNIRGTYLDDQNNEWVFSPKSVSGMDGSISIQGQVVSYYRLMDENSIYIGAQFSRDGYIGMPFTLNGSQLKLFTGEGDETRIFTKISDSY
ncbi:hypothetical protein [Herpetosiphon llansteffanensis]|uniref:hypothetical protein n=1 Tax=Herpetosiphon llansteffanensis TaxID=2094568 RepID=UPI000D7CDFAB|nr:hypothetical protein [Herpetosiphon llansteffanensis]